MEEKEQKKIRWIIPVLIVAIAVCGIGGYLIGKNAGASQSQKKIAKSQEEVEHYEEQEEITTELNRSELDGLGEIEGPIYVSGHFKKEGDGTGDHRRSRGQPERVSAGINTAAP